MSSPNRRALALPVAPFAFACFLAPLCAHATNGYFSNGYGAKSEGEGGVGIALAQDSLAAASNPAGTALVGNRIDLGLDWFIPRRSAEIVGNAFGADETYSGDGKKNFFIPSIGYAQQLSDTLAAGVAIYGNGGLDTK
jgi:long-chain fatty acid transport protein